MITIRILNPGENARCWKVQLTDGQSTTDTGIGGGDVELLKQHSKSCACQLNPWEVYSPWEPKRAYTGNARPTGQNGPACTRQPSARRTSWTKQICALSGMERHGSLLSSVRRDVKYNSRFSSVTDGVIKSHVCGSKKHTTQGIPQSSPT